MTFIELLPATTLPHWALQPNQTTSLCYCKREIKHWCIRIYETTVQSMQRFCTKPTSIAFLTIIIKQIVKLVEEIVSSKTVF